MRRTINVLVFSALLACGGSQDQPRAPATSGGLVAHSGAAAAPSSTSPSAGAPADAPSADGKGPFHFTDYQGPKVKATIDTAKVWGVQPVGAKNAWDLLKFAREDFARLEGNEVVIKHFDGAEIYVPGALAFPAKAASGIKKGDAVMADVAAASTHARVVSVDKDGDETKVRIKYLWGGSTSDDALSLDQVVKMGDEVTYGNRVAWKTDGKWECGDYAGGDKKAAFVIDSSGRPQLVEIKDLKPLKIASVYKKGDRVWAATFDGLVPGKITEVVEGGIGYRVKLDKGDSKDVLEFDKVTSPLD
jgi:hypothetical protein